MTEFAVFRISDKKSGGKIKSREKLAAALRHNLRAEPTPNADPSRPIEVLRGPDNPADAMARFEEMLAEPGMTKPRSNGVLAVEIVISMSYQSGKRLKEEGRLHEWRDTMLYWFESQMPDENILSAVFHDDETTPHLQIIFIPIDRTERKKGAPLRLNASRWFGGRDNMRAWQNSVAEFGAGFGLQRGQEGSKAEHNRVRKFYETMPKLKAQAEAFTSQRQIELKEATDKRAALDACLVGIEAWSRGQVEPNGSAEKYGFRRGSAISEAESETVWTPLKSSLTLGGRLLWNLLRAASDAVKQKVEQEWKRLKEFEARLQRREQDLLEQEAESEARLQQRSQWEAEMEAHYQQRDHALGHREAELKARQQQAFDQAFDKGLKQGRAAGVADAKRIAELTQTARRVEAYFRHPDIAGELKRLNLKSLYDAEQLAGVMSEDKPSPRTDPAPGNGP